MLRDLFKDLVQWYARSPIPLAARSRCIQHHPGKIVGATGGFASDLVFTKARRAPGTQLSQRHRRRDTAANVLHSLTAAIGRLHLSPDQRGEVTWVQAIAHLMSCAIEADVAQRPSSQVRIDPERKNSLVRFTELAGAGEHTAAIDPDREAKSHAVLEGKDFGGKFGRAIDRQWRRGGEILRDALGRQASRRSGIDLRLLSALLHRERQ